MLGTGFQTGVTREQKLDTSSLRLDEVVYRTLRSALLLRIGGSRV
jgi:hypothetical protein